MKRTAHHSPGALTAWMDSAGRYKILSHEETVSIAEKISKLDSSSPEYSKYVNKLTVHNLRLVISFVENFLKRKTNKTFGCSETVDYLQVGALGLRRAAELYNHSSGYRFSTYSYPWIRSFVSRYNMKTSSIFHVPENACRESWQYENRGYILKKKKGNTSGRKDDNYCIDLCERVKAAQAPLFLDAPSDPKRNKPLAETVESPDSPVANFGEFFPEIEDMLREANLSSLQVEVLRSFYIDGMTAVRISESKGLHREKVNQIKQSAILALKSVNGLL